MLRTLMLLCFEDLWMKKSLFCCCFSPQSKLRNPPIWGMLSYCGSTKVNGGATKREKGITQGLCCSQPRASGGAKVRTVVEPSKCLGSNNLILQPQAYCILLLTLFLSEAGLGGLATCCKTAISAFAPPTMWATNSKYDGY